MKKLLIALLASALSVALLVSCTSSASSEQPRDSGEAPEESSVEVIPGIANPWHDAETMDEALRGAGIERFTLPEVIFAMGDYDGYVIRYMEGLVEVRYSDGTNTLLLRKGSGEEDVSGDYNSYSDVKEIAHKGLSITCKGNGDGYKLATWSFGGESYSLSWNIGDDSLPGLDVDSVVSIVNQIS